MVTGMNFEFASAAKVIFGRGSLGQMKSLARQFGKRAFVVTGASGERARPLLSILEEELVDYGLFSVPGEPTTDLIKEAASLAAGFDFTVGMGGGSAIDTAKAVAALLPNGGEPLDYLEVIGKGKALSRPSIPFIAIPTTAGTGAEVTHNAVMESRPHRVKVSLRSPHMFARVAIVDPELSVSAPPHVTASAGLDALTQVIEPYLSKQSNPMADAICREGIRRAARSLRRAYEYPGDIDAREDMSLASLFGGMALANAKLGAVHGFAGPLGGMFSAGHGALCASLLVSSMETNHRALMKRMSGSEALHRFDEVAELLTGSRSALAADGIRFLRELCGSLGVSPLSAYGIKREDFPAIIEKARASSSMKGNPLELTEEELQEILERSL